MNQELQQRVQQLIDGLVESGEEVGLQVAAYVDGEPAVDAWAGVADEATGHRVDGDTLFTSWSTTKGFVATRVHILADRGRLDYDAPMLDARGDYVVTWGGSFRAGAIGFATPSAIAITGPGSIRVAEERGSYRQKLRLP